ncbi:MAG: hypothetical protein Q8R60_07725 [Mycobacteriales bacterium]|nr:hypothetical protein [Mycobacteriales bacterium]
MSIEDRLTAGGSAWRESQPPVTVSPLMEVRRKPVLWLPFTAAAATVAVVLGASVLVSRDDSPAPVASGVVPYADLRAGETDVPAPLGFADFPASSSPAISYCEETDVVGRFTVLAQGRGRFSFTSNGVRDCLLASQAGVRLSTVTGRGGEYSTLAREPRLAGDAGGYPQRVLGQDPLLVDLDFSGQCLVAEGFAVEGIVPGVLRVAGTPVCADVTDDERFEAGPLHVAGEPHAPVPDDRAGLRVEIEVDGPAPTSGPLDYRVRLSNPTSEPISLDPCPAYVTGLYRKDSSGESYSGSGGRLNCHAAPDAVPAGGSVVFAMRHETTDPDGIPGPTDVQAMSLRWAIAGPAPASADVRVASPAPSSAQAATPSSSSGGATPAGAACRARDLEARFEGRQAASQDGSPRIDRFLVVRKTTSGGCLLRGVPVGAVFVQDGDLGAGVNVEPAKQPSPVEMLLERGQEAVAILQHGTCAPPTERTYFAFRLPSGDDLRAEAPVEADQEDGGALRQCDLLAYAFAPRS